MARRENDLGNDKIVTLLLRLAIPAMVAQFVNVLYGIVDRIFIGNIEVIGSVALSGVGVCAPIVTLITSFSFLVGLGGSPLMAMRLGEGNRENAEKIMSNSFFMLIVTSVLITIVFLVFRKPMLMAFGASDNTFQYANDYLTVYAAGTIFSILATGLNSFITAQGYSKISMMTVLIGAIINIILDPILIFVCGLNVVGAAVATVISQAVSALWVILFLRGKRSVVKLSLRGLSLNVMAKIMKFGITPFLVIMTDSVVLIMFNAQLQKYGGVELGDTLVGAGVIVTSFMQLITMPMGGITMGCQPILSYNYGACKLDRVKHAFIGLNVICLIFTGIMFIIALTLGGYFVQLFTNDPTMSELAVKGIHIYTMGIIVLALQYACVDGLTALGQPQASLPLSLIRKIGVMTVAVYVLPIWLGYEGVFYAEPLADIVSGILSLVVSIIILPKIMKKKEALGVVTVNY